ncbi:hypothetical protein M378DRAFT_184407 [Amanita muscaria Koide BX008]|uniref:amidase n=1 Tax=Amanita muscaria (strain Koide BX008) TaxID=946122 RepID=A0A0C2XJE2_AMAMK|nr:hypothetical protein M378DRAFT_184407 [Amanita muscaria Koide BX008]
MVSAFQKVVDAKRDARARALALAGPLSPEHSKYTTATASEIVSHIEKGEWTASDVLEAYISRAVLAHETTNCLTEVMFESARKQAKTLDDEFSATGKLRGPLHGVPVSIKDQYDIAGVDTSLGFSQWTNKPAKENCSLADQFITAGAVPFVKTNVPQTMFAFECSNPLFGRTTNPYNDAYTSGGSSGGEAALLAMDGSALGIGTDVGGSLRIPTAYCGIYALKPTAGRLSMTGAKGPTPGFEGIKTVSGPMGRCIDDLELMCRTSFGVPGNDNNVIPLPFREVELPKTLRFGYYITDNFVKASPACQRAVLETVEALRKEGHECVEIEIPDNLGAFEIFVGLSSADGYKTLLSHLGPDPMEKALFLVSLGPSLPSFVRSFATWVIEKFVGDPIFAHVFRAARTKPMNEYMQYCAARDKYIKMFYQEVWDKQGIDGLIAPVQSMPQVPHGTCENFIAIGEATTLFNLVDSSVGSLPVTRVDPEKDKITEKWISEPGHGSTILEKGLFTSEKALYDPEAMKGMPVGIQIAGRRWEEEKVLSMMRVIDEALGKDRGFGPGSWDRYKAKKSM